MANNKAQELPIQEISKPLSSTVDLEQIMRTGERLDGFLDIPFNVRSVETRDGRHGQFILMECQNINTSESLLIQTGGRLVVRIMSEIAERNRLPVSCVFHRQQGSDMIFVRDVLDADIQK